MTHLLYWSPGTTLLSTRSWSMSWSSAKALLNSELPLTKHVAPYLSQPVVFLHMFQLHQLQRLQPSCCPLTTPVVSAVAVCYPLVVGSLNNAQDQMSTTSKLCNSSGTCQPMHRTGVRCSCSHAVHRSRFRESSKCVCLIWVFADICTLKCTPYRPCHVT